MTTTYPSESRQDRPGADAPGLFSRSPLKLAASSLGQKTSNSYINFMPITSAPGPFFAAWNFVKTRLGSDREKRDFRAESELLDGLRHADFASNKYLITLYMKSGRTIIGRIGDGQPYDHESYDKHRGTLMVMPEREYPKGVSYEQCLVRLSDIEGFLLQDVKYASPEDVRRLNLEAEQNSQVLGHGADTD